MAACEARDCLGGGGTRGGGWPVASAGLSATLLRRVVTVAVRVLVFLLTDAHPRPAEVSEPQRRLQDRTYQRRAGNEALHARSRTKLAHGEKRGLEADCKF